MEKAVKTRLESVRLGEPQSYKNITIVPLVAPDNGTLQYHTLSEALATQEVAINEVSNAGSVPELMVVNRGKESVLLIDGEELAGAKQNRVLNTSILLKEGCETKIPVSCTEQGRWSYSSQFFSSSGNIMAHKSRSRKTSSVHMSLQSLGSFSSDQGEVWANIAELHSKSQTNSPTSAMSDVYKAREEDLRKCDDIFKPVANQVGLLAFISGAPAGADMVSLAAAYTRLHARLVRSYALEGLLESGSPSQPDSATPPPPDPAVFTERARSFLEEIASAEEQQFPSIGHGTDFRYRTPVAATPGQQLSTICGSALVHQNEVIHAAFFRLEEPADSPARSAPPHRSRWRRFT
jgi:hypothetical protein